MQTNGKLKHLKQTFYLFVLPYFYSKCEDGGTKWIVYDSEP